MSDRNVYQLMTLIFSVIEDCDNAEDQLVTE